VFADFVPCISIVSILVVVLGFVAFMRYLSYKETLALAEKGLTRPETTNNKGLLRWGIIVTALGVALTLGLYLVGFDAGGNYPLHFGPWMLGGFIPLFLGISLILVHYFSEKN